MKAAALSGGRLAEGVAARRPVAEVARAIGAYRWHAVAKPGSKVELHCILSILSGPPELS